MLGVGHKFPAYSLQAVVSLEKGKAFQTVSNEDFKDQWKVLFFWPKDFTFVCPTEIAAFGKLNGEFQDRDASYWAVAPTANSSTTPGGQATPTSGTCPFPCWPTSNANSAPRSAFWILRKAWPSAPPSSSIPTTSSVLSLSTIYR